MALFLSSFSLCLVLIPSTLHRAFGVNVTTACWTWFTVADVFLITVVLGVKVFFIEQELGKRRRKR